MSLRVFLFNTYEIKVVRPLLPMTLFMMRTMCKMAPIIQAILSGFHILDDDMSIDFNQSASVKRISLVGVQLLKSIYGGMLFS